MTTTAEDVWRILAELATSQKETDRQLQRTDQQLQRTDQQLQETDRQFQETKNLLREESQETDRQLRQVSEEIKQLSKEIRAVNKQIGDLGGKWGRFVENMVAPACETLFLERGIPIHQVSQRVKKRSNGETLEIDVLVTNENHVLTVEVKSTLSVNDIKEFMQSLTEFKRFFPEYAQKQVYGAVAGIEIEKGADKFAYRQGLFVLAQTGENVSILNDGNFQPKIW